MRFWFRLALALGATVQEIQSRMSSYEFAQWIAFDQIEPFGEDRADLRAAQICSTLANCMGKREGGGSFVPNDFMFDFTGERAKARQKTPSQMQNEMRLTFLVLSEIEEGKAAARG